MLFGACKIGQKLAQKSHLFSGLFLVPTQNARVSAPLKERKGLRVAFRLRQGCQQTSGARPSRPERPEPISGEEGGDVDGWVATLTVPPLFLSLPHTTVCYLHFGSAI